MKKVILITGGMGYIGSHAVVAFEKAGYKTVIVDNLVNSNTSTLLGIEKILGYKPDFFEVDLRNKEKLREVFKKYNFDGVIHFAGLKAPFESQIKCIEYFQNNIGGSLDLFEVMNEFDVKKIVFSSSANTYSTINNPPIKETDIQDTTNPYGTSKLLIEKILRDLSKFNSFNAINLRYFNPIGAHKSGYIGEKPDGIPNNLFPFIFKVINNELPQLQVFGNDYETIDGSGVRDYIDVIDLVEAHLLAYKYIEDNFNSDGYVDFFNVGTGKGISVLQAINTIEKTLNLKINFSITKRREGDIPISYCDTNKINKILGFTPKITIEESIKNMYNFYLNNQK